MGKNRADEPEYTVTVQNDGNGTAAADMNAAIPGTEITLTATANEGYRFKEWQVVSGGVTITDNRFTMPTSDVVVKAIFEEIPAPAFTVTVNNGTGTGSYPPGATVTITADEAADGWVFDKWVSDDGVAFADASEATTTFDAWIRTLPLQQHINRKTRTIRETIKKMIRMIRKTIQRTFPKQAIPVLHGYGCCWEVYRW